MENHFHRLQNDHSKNPGKWYEHEEEFFERFEKYQTGGDLNNTQLFAEI